MIAETLNSNLVLVIPTALLGVARDSLVIRATTKDAIQDVRREGWVFQ